MGKKPRLMLQLDSDQDLRHKYWEHWIKRFTLYPELNDMRLKVMLTLIVISPSTMTHSELQDLFNLTDKTIRGLRKILQCKGWTNEQFKNRNINICPTEQAKELFGDYIVGSTLPKVLFYEE